MRGLPAFCCNAQNLAALKSILQKTGNPPTQNGFFNHRALPA